MPPNPLAASAACVSLCFLAACGGGGGAGVSQGGGGPDVTPNPDLTYADGTPIVASSYHGKSFPVSFVVASDDGSGSLERVTGTLEYKDADTVILTYGGESRNFTFRGSFGVENFGSGVLTADDGSLISDLLLYNPKLGGRVLKQRTSLPEGAGSTAGDYTYGTFGFSTPENRLPNTSVNYTGNYHTYMVANFEGEPELVHLEDGKMDVDVDFATGDVSGTLFERDLVVSEPGDPFRELNISIGVENGKVEGSGFSGDVTGTFGINDTALTTTFSNDGVDGFFFGNDAEVLAGTYDAEFTASNADETISGSLAGVFHGERD